MTVGGLVGLTGAVVGATGAAEGFTGAVVGAIGAGVGAIGAGVGETGAFVGAIGASVGAIGASVGATGAFVGATGALVGGMSIAATQTSSRLTTSGEAILEHAVADQDGSPELMSVLPETLRNRESIILLPLAQFVHGPSAAQDGSSCPPPKANAAQNDPHWESLILFWYRIKTDAQAGVKPRFL